MCSLHIQSRLPANQRERCQPSRGVDDRDTRPQQLLDEARRRLDVLQLAELLTVPVSLQCAARLGSCAARSGRGKVGWIRGMPAAGCKPSQRAPQAPPPCSPGQPCWRPAWHKTAQCGALLATWPLCERRCRPQAAPAAPGACALLPAPLQPLTHNQYQGLQHPQLPAELPGPLTCCARRHSWPWGLH